MSSTILKPAKLALKSLCLVFCDIIPTYQITELTQQQQDEKLSKEVRALRNYESNLLEKYK